MAVINGRGVWGVRAFIPGSTASSSNWTRPEDWLAMPTIGTQEFIGLLAITNDESNHIALLCTGAYTVDWGDGVVENIATGVKAQHTYTYSSINDNTISTLGYKQVLVRVTPQAGQNLTSINLQQQHSTLAKLHTTGWLDLAIKGSNITALVLGGGTVRQGMCERVTISALGNITSLANTFDSLIALQSVPLFNTSTVSNFTSTFYGCISLREVPEFNMSAATVTVNMFWGCASLEAVPAFNTSLVNNFSSMFYGCNSLESVGLINTSAATNLTSMFEACWSLESVPLFNTSNVTSFSGMFSACYNLESVPLLDTSKGTNFSNMFISCYRLRSVPLLDTSKGLNFNSMFATTGLSTIPLINTSLGTSFTYMFSTCIALVSVPLIDLSKGTNFTGMFQNCYALQQIPEFNVSLGTNFGSMFNFVNSIAKGKMIGGRYSISYTNQCLGRAEIVDIFNGLGTAVGAQTITVTTNPGSAALTLTDKAIATAKGWTVAA